IVCRSTRTPITSARRRRTPSVETNSVPTHACGSSSKAGRRMIAAPKGAVTATATALVHSMKWRRFMSASWWEHALQGDAKVESEVGHHVVVRLVAAGGGKCLHRGGGVGCVLVEGAAG